MIQSDSVLYKFFEIMIKMRKPVCLLIAAMLICGAVAVSCKSKKKVQIKLFKITASSPCYGCYNREGSNPIGLQ